MRSGFTHCAVLYVERFTVTPCSDKFSHYYAQVPIRYFTGTYAQVPIRYLQNKTTIPSYVIAEVALRTTWL